VIVRTATQEDAAAIAATHVAAWREAYRGIIPDSVLSGLSLEQRRSRWEATIARMCPPESVLVALDGGNLVGFAYVCGSADEDPRDGVGELDGLYVAPDRWRLGIGTRLQQRALDALTGCGFQRAGLWVLEANERARRFYEHTGWALADRSRTIQRAGTSIGEVRYRRPLV
jgi:GNAT superfamily N-acetyltransferase